MAPLLPTNTARFRFHLTNQGHQHTTQVRSTASPAAIGGRMNDFLNALAPVIAPNVLDFVDFAPAGSDIFNPVVTGFEGTSYGTGIPLVSNEPIAVGFLGRTPGGRRVRMFVFGCTTLAANYRFSAGENAAVDAARNVLVIAGGQFMGIDGLTPVWKTYANVKPNDHWVGIIR